MRNRSLFLSLSLVVLLALPACGGGEDTTSAVSGLCGADIGPAPLRRITRFEYGRTLANLTGVDPTLAESLPPDEKSLGFDNIAEAYSVSSLHAARYLEVAEAAGPRWPLTRGG